MKDFKLGQTWVTQITNADGPEVSAIGSGAALTAPPPGGPMLTAEQQIVKIQTDFADSFVDAHDDGLYGQIRELVEQFYIERDTHTELLHALAALEQQLRARHGTARKAALNRDQDPELRGQAWGESGAFREAADRIAALLKGA